VELLKVLFNKGAGNELERGPVDGCCECGWETGFEEGDSLLWVAEDLLEESVMRMSG
jgi:hypothetical protein